MPSDGAHAALLDQADGSVGGQLRPDEQGDGQRGQRRVKQGDAARMLAGEERDDRADERAAR